MISKRAQAAGAAAGVIAIIAGLIVLYILLLPPDARDELLNQSSTSTSGNSKTLEKISLVLEHPGTLDPVRNTDREKILDSFSLYSEKSALVLKSVDAVHIENGWFSTKTYNLSFSVEDASNTENYVVAFDADQAAGNLVLFLNGKEVYNGAVQPGNTQPITLDKSDIQKDNSVYFTVSGVGLAFWKLNEFDLKNVRVIADFTDASKREYNNFFIISATEKENLEKTKLVFVPNCLTQHVGPMKIEINNRDLHYSAIPDCGLLSTIEFDPAILKQGENVITFSANEGNYFVDRVSIKSDLKKLNYPFYYFELTQEDFNKVTDKKANVTLEMRFTDLEQKTGEINVNGHISRLDTTNSTLNKNINIYVEEGQNYVQVTPKTIINIVDLAVILAK